MIEKILPVKHSDGILTRPGDKFVVKYRRSVQIIRCRSAIFWCR